jgi:hypothetical protein
VVAVTVSPLSLLVKLSPLAPLPSPFAIILPRVQQARRCEGSPSNSCSITVVSLWSSETSSPVLLGCRFARSSLSKNRHQGARIYIISPLHQHSSSPLPLRILPHSSAPRTPHHTTTHTLKTPDLTPWPIPIAQSVQARRSDPDPRPLLIYFDHPKNIKVDPGDQSSFFRMRMRRLM